MCRLLTCWGVLLGLLAVQSSGYFVINDPSAQREWVNNAANLVTWSKGLLDGIDGFDVEMARMSTDGLVLVARNVPVKPAQLNIMLQNVPAGDDYFLIFLNSTHGIMHATSHRFTILAPNASPTSTPPAAVPNVPTVTVSGTPNPAQQFATTFPAMANSATRNSMVLDPHHIVIILMNVVFCLFGALWTVA